MFHMLYFWRLVVRALFTPSRSPTLPLFFYFFVYTLRLSNYSLTTNHSLDLWSLARQEPLTPNETEQSGVCYKLHPLELCSLATNGTQERTPDDEPPAVL